MHAVSVLPDAATSAMGLFVTCDIKPTIEKMTKPANMLVHELIQHTMIESLEAKISDTHARIIQQ